MRSPRARRAKTYALLALMVTASSLGDVLLSKGMKRVDTIGRWSSARLGALFLDVFANSTIWLGIGCLLLFFVFYLLLLTWADYSYVLPASAVGYALVALLGYLLLDEAVTPLRWAGVGLICLGVGLVGGTPASTTLED